MDIVKYFGTGFAALVGLFGLVSLFVYVCSETVRWFVGMIAAVILVGGLSFMLGIMIHDALGR